MVWEKSGQAYYATVLGPDDVPRFNLVVERLPEGLWDFTVWRPGDEPELAVRGVARTASEAIRLAELAAR